VPSMQSFHSAAVGVSSYRFRSRHGSDGQHNVGLNHNFLAEIGIPVLQARAYG
jgi:hypothetical protein